MYHLTDEELTVKLRSGAKEAAGLLYERYKGKILAYFYNNTKRKDVSEDLLQVTFEKMLRYLPNSSKIEKFKPWIFSIARNVYIDFYNKAKKHRTAEWEDENESKILTVDVDDWDEKAAQLQLLQRALSGISFEKRELISMVKLNGMIYKEAAEIYETTEANIKVRVYRIMKELKQIMAKMTTNG